MNIVIVYIIAYLVGSVPTGYWFARWFFHIDVTQHGSGNIGATNVARVLGSKKYFFLIFALDMIKAALLVYLMNTVYGATAVQQITAASILMLGNTHSIFLRFRGGKGVSTYIGCLIVLSPITASIFISSWILSLCATTQNDKSSLIATVTTLGYALWTQWTRGALPMNIFVFVASVLIIIKHRRNIMKLIV